MFKPVRGSKTQKKDTYGSRKSILWGFLRKLCYGSPQPYGRSRGVCSLTWYLVRGVRFVLGGNLKVCMGLKRDHLRDLKNPPHLGGTEDWGLTPQENQEENNCGWLTTSTARAIQEVAVLEFAFTPTFVRAKEIWVLPTDQRWTYSRRWVAWSCFDFCPSRLPGRAMRLWQ